MVVVRSGDSERPPTSGTGWHDPPVSGQLGHDWTLAGDAPPDLTGDNRPTLLGVAPPDAPSELQNDTTDLEANGYMTAERAVVRHAKPVASRAARVLRSRWTVAAVGGLLGSVVTLAVVQRRGTTECTEAAPKSGVRSDTKTLAPLVASAAALPAAQPVASAVSPQLPADAAPAVPEVTRVTLEVFPPNAKVTFPGGGWTGPVGEVDVPRGRRVVLLIARKGYAARRLVLDGTKRRMFVGLVKKPSE